MAETHPDGTFWGSPSTCESQHTAPINELPSLLGPWTVCVAVFSILDLSALGLLICTQAHINRHVRAPREPGQTPRHFLQSLVNESRLRYLQAIVRLGAGMTIGTYDRKNYRLSFASLFIALVALLFAVGPPVYKAYDRWRNPPETCQHHPDLHPADPARVGATSTHDTEVVNSHRFSYTAKNLIDGDDSTAWVPAGGKGGAGQSVTFTWASAQDVQLVCIVNGYASDERTYRINGAVDDLSVTTQLGGNTGSIQYLPEDPQRRQKAPLRRGKTTTLQISIQSYYTAFDQGSLSQRDTAISEVHVFTR